MMNSAFLLLTAILLSASTFAADPTLPAPAPIKPTFRTAVDPATGLSRLYMTRGDATKTAEVMVGTFKTIKAGEIFYHWSDQASYDEWTTKGLNQTGFDALRSNFQNEAAGGGFYASRDPFNSSDYGVKCVEIHAPHDLKYFAGGLSLTAPELALLFPDQATVKRTSEEGVAEILQTYGANVWEYSQQGTSMAWLNFMALDTIGTLKPVNIADQIASMSAGGAPDLIRWAYFDTKIGIPKIEAVRLADPDVYAYYLEGNRDPALMARLRARIVAWIDLSATDAQKVASSMTFSFQLGSVANQFSTDLAHASLEAPTFLNSFRRDFRSDIVNAAIAKIAQLPPSTPQTAYQAMNLKSNALFMGVPPTDIGLPGEGFSFAMMPTIKPRSYPVPAPVPNPFGTKFQAAQSYLSLEDTVVAMAQGNSTPWTFYDEAGRAPFADRWTAAMTNYGKQSNFMNTAISKMQGGMIIVNGQWVPPPTPALPAQIDIAQKRHPKAQLALMIETNRIISEDPKANLRGTVAIGEGNVVVGDKRYYRLEAWKKDRLLNHPFLVAEVIPDPENPGNFLARHEYPSAHTYKKFNSLLSPRLQKQLADADTAGKLAIETSPEFKRLTQAIVAELINGPAGKVISDQYGWIWRASAVYPFGRDTDHVLQFMQSNTNGIPTGLKSWRQTLFFTDEEFNTMMQNQGWKLYAANSTSFQQAVVDNPIDPDYYGHSPLLDAYFGHNEFSQPGDAWRTEHNAILNSSTGQKTRSDGTVLPSWDPNDCIELFRAASTP
jgi:hypothetical protein